MPLKLVVLTLITSFILANNTICAQSFLSDSVINDTLFLTKTSRQVIYIAPLKVKDSLLKSMSDFHINSHDSAELQSLGIDLEKINNNNIDTSIIPLNWLPLYYYNGKYYLYYRCDDTKIFNISIQSSMLVEWYMYGVTTKLISSIKKEDDKTYLLKIKNEGNIPSICTLYAFHTVGENENMTIVESFCQTKESRKALYTSLENAPQFDIIVNDCRYGKNDGINFDSIDFDMLLHNK